jgi:hypothetical protein
MQMIADDPAILNSSNYGNIQEWVSKRAELEGQKQIEQPFSNSVLGPAIMRKLEPQDQLRFKKYIDQGIPASDAYDMLERDKKTLQEELDYTNLEEEAAKAGVPIERINLARTSPNRKLFLASEMGAASKAGKAGGKDTIATPMDEADKLLGIIGKLEEMGDMERAEKFRKRLDAIDFDAAKKPAINPSTGAVIPQGDFDIAAEQAKLDAARKEDELAQDAAASGAVRKPLSAFEVAEDERQSARLAKEASSRQELNAAWTGAKDTPVSRVPAAEGTQPQRLMRFAQAAVVGKPIQGATQQERQLAQLMADYATRAASGEMVNIGTQSPTTTMDVAGGGDVAPLPVESENAKTPGYAFLLELGGDPEEIITIPGAGRFGGVRQIPAWQLMDLRLKEIGQPLIDRDAVQEQAEASEAVKTKAAKFRGK